MIAVIDYKNKSSLLTMLLAVFHVLYMSVQEKLG
jgi:hypothetical protein